MKDDLDRELALLGVPREATPIATAVELIAAAKGTSAVAVGLTGWALWLALATTLTGGVGIGLASAILVDRFDSHVFLDDARAQQPVVAWLQTSQEAYTLDPECEAVEGATSEGAMVAQPFCPAVVPVVLSDCSGAEDAVAADEFEWTPPPLDSAVAVAPATSLDVAADLTDAPVARPPSKQGRDLRVHIGLGPSLGEQPAVGIRAGGRAWMPSPGGLGPSVGAAVAVRSGDGALGAESSIDYGLRRDRLAVTGGWALGVASFGRDQDVDDQGQGQDRARLVGLTGPRVSASWGPSTRGALYSAAGLDLPLSGGPSAPWLAVGIELRPSGKD